MRIAFFVLSLIAAAFASLHLPRDVPDGQYEFEVSPDGTVSLFSVDTSRTVRRVDRVRMKYATTDLTTTDSVKPPLAKRGDHHTCIWGSYSSDHHASSQAMISRCGTGYTITARALTLREGNSTSYVCNYGGTQTCYAKDVGGFYGVLDTQCGWSTTAYYSKEAWNVSFGRAVPGQGFC